MYDWDLRPTLFRKIQTTDLKLEENARIENFIAKNNQFFMQTPASEAEWLEVMQHHDVSTRLLDWSESAAHSLIFTLEYFFKPDAHFNIDRINAILVCHSINTDIERAFCLLQDIIFWLSF